MEAYNAALQQYRPELASLELGMKEQDSLLAATNTGLEAKRKEYETAAKNNVGFLERNKALSDLG